MALLSDWPDIPYPDLSLAETLSGNHNGEEEEDHLKCEITNVQLSPLPSHFSSNINLLSCPI